MPKFIVKLNRNGRTISQKLVDSTNKVSLTEELKKSANEPYSSDFIKFDTEKYGSTKIVYSDTVLHVLYYDKNTSEQVGEVIYEKGKVRNAWIEEQINDYIIKREESFLHSGKPEKKRLLIYTQGYNFPNLVHFCYEKYKDGNIDLFATSISDPSISSGEGDYVRYLYLNGKAKTKEIFKGKSFRYKFLSNYESERWVPRPALYCVQGNLAARYTIDYSDIRKETDFKRTDMPCMIIDSRLDTEKFVDLHSAQASYIPLYEQSEIFNESICKIQLQHESFQIPAVPPKEKETNDIIYDVDASQLDGFLRDLELKEDVFQSIRIHGSLSLINDSDCDNLFTQYLSNPKAIVEIDMSDCRVENSKYLHFHNCPALYSLSFPKEFNRLRRTTISECQNLHYIVLPESVVAVDTGAFYGCSSTKRFFLYPTITFNSLLYNTKILAENHHIEICSEQGIYRDGPESLRRSKFDGVGYISLPRSFVNGAAISKYAKEFQDEIGLNPYELKLLLQEEYCIIGKDLVTFDYYRQSISSTSPPLTGTDAVIELMRRKNIEEKYSTVIVDKIPVPAYIWRSKYISNGYPVDTQLNQLYKELLSAKDHYRLAHSMAVLNESHRKKIQSILFSIAQNRIYQSAMWYLRKTHTLQ